MNESEKAYATMLIDEMKTNTAMTNHAIAKKASEKAGCTMYFARKYTGKQPPHSALWGATSHQGNHGKERKNRAPRGLADHAAERKPASTGS